MYVDDALFGAQAANSAIEVRNKFISLLKHGSMKLHKWAANNKCLLTDTPADKCYFEEHDLCQETLSMKALGLTYNIKNDQLVVLMKTYLFGTRDLFSVL